MREGDTTTEGIFPSLFSLTPIPNLQAEWPLRRDSFALQSSDQNLAVLSEDTSVEVSLSVASGNKSAALCW